MQTMLNNKTNQTNKKKHVLYDLKPMFVNGHCKWPSRKTIYVQFKINHNYTEQKKIKQTNNQTRFLSFYIFRVTLDRVCQFSNLHA